MISLFKKSKEEKLKAISNKIDFYVMELMSYEKLPAGDEEIKKHIVMFLNMKIGGLLIRYKELLISND